MSLRVCYLPREGTLDSGGKLVSCWYEESVLPVSGLFNVTAGPKEGEWDEACPSPSSHQSLNPPFPFPWGPRGQEAGPFRWLGLRILFSVYNVIAVVITCAWDLL